MRLLLKASDLQPGFSRVPLEEVRYEYFTTRVREAIKLIGLGEYSSDGEYADIRPTEESESEIHD